jgi:hypothetical protein
VEHGAQVSSWLWYAFGARPCPHCGADVPVPELFQGEHECDPGAVERQQADEARAAVHVLLAEIAAYLDSPDGRARVAFARWCRERDHC